MSAIIICIHQHDGHIYAEDESGELHVALETTGDSVMDVARIKAHALCRLADWFDSGDLSSELVSIAFNDERT